MNSHLDPVYTHPQETWDAKECAKRAKARRQPGGKPGLIAGSSSSYPEYGQTVRFNGGREIDGNWYQSECRPLPVIAPGFHFEKVVSWGTYIVKDKVNA